MESANKISLDRVIGNVMGNLGVKDVDSQYDDFARWACEAVNKIGSTSSYRRFECELTIRNKKATLPPNFVYLHALKFGQKIVPVTKRSFRMFNKGSNTLLDNTETQNYIANNKQTDIPGVPRVTSIDFSGAFLIGDQISITITTNNCDRISTNTYTYIVQGGDTLTTIAAQFASQINAITNVGYSATSNSTSVIITGDSPDVIINISLYTDSINGSLTENVIQNRVPTKVRTATTSSKNGFPKTTSKNLADSNVAKLNTGINRQGPSNAVGSYPYQYDFETSDQVFSIDNGCINFNAYDDTKIGISYMGIDLDDNGYPMISEIHEDAVTHYMMYMYKSIDYWNGKLPQHVWMNLQNRWFDLCGQARGDDEMPNSEEMKYLSNLWMQLVPLPSKENF